MSFSQFTQHDIDLIARAIRREVLEVALRDVVPVDMLETVAELLAVDDDLPAEVDPHEKERNGREGSVHAVEPGNRDLDLQVEELEEYEHHSGDHRGDECVFIFDLDRRDELVHRGQYQY